MVLPFTMVVKVPTAYIVLPHCTSWRICWTGLSAVAFRCGVLLAGVDDTTPDGGCSPPVPAWAAGTANASSPAAAATMMKYFRTLFSLSARSPQPGPATRWQAAICGPFDQEDVESPQKVDSYSHLPGTKHPTH